MRVTLSCDHRACSGADGAKLLQTIKQLLAGSVAAAGLTRPGKYTRTMQLTDVMSTSLVAVTPETRVGDAARRMVEADVGAAIVLADGDDLVGVITERDLLRCVSEGIDPTRAGVRPHDPPRADGLAATELAEAMALMVDGHFRHLPVVNDEGHVIGLASMRDLMAYTSLRLRQRQHRAPTTTSTRPR